MKGVGLSRTYVCWKLLTSPVEELDTTKGSWFHSDSASRQLQQQQQAELDRGGNGEGLYEAGPITLSQVSPGSWWDSAERICSLLVEQDHGRFGDSGVGVFCSPRCPASR